MNLPQPLIRPVRAVVRRVRAQRALDAGVTLGLAGLGVAAVVVGMLKSGVLTEADALQAFAAAAALPVLGALVGALRPVPRLLAAQLLDRAHDLHDRVASAVAFAGKPESERTAFEQAAIADAVTHAAGLRPSRAMPLRTPRDTVGCLGLAIGVAVLSTLEVPGRAEIPVATRLTPLVLHADDVDAFQSGLDELMRDPEMPEEVRDAADRFNQIMEDLADRRLERTEALRRIAELERRMAAGRAADAEDMRESLRRLGNELARAELTREASEALRDGDAARAEQEMRELAEQLRQERNAPSRQELERMREALERASQSREEDRRAEIERRREEVRRMLERDQKQQQNERDRRLLQRRQRELERLEREQEQSEERQRQLERLQREMDEAAQDLERGDREEAAQNMDQAAEDLNRMAREQMSEEEMEQLRQRLSELREQIRRQREQQAQNGQNGQQGQQGQQGRGQQQGQGAGRMDCFVARARGQGEQGEDGMPLMAPGQQGQGQGQQGEQQGQQGQGGDQPGEQQGLMMGQGGNAVLELPGMGGQRPGQGRDGPQQGAPREGPGAGTGHDPTMLNDPTRTDSSTRSVRVDGQPSRGPTRSEVILGAADRGFVSTGYRNVYREYSDHAEEVLEQDEIPAGYRFYVRRYFQLIRPRDE